MYSKKLQILSCKEIVMLV